MSLGTARSASLTVKNISTLDAAESDAVEQELQLELTRRGLQVTADLPPETVIEVTLSQGTEGYLWIAKIHARAVDQIVMVTVRRPQSIEAKVKSVPVLREHLLLRQPETILDFALATGPDGVQTLLLLEQDRLVLLQRNGDQWEMRDSVPIAHARPWPRDLRGRMVLSAPSEFKALLPGVVCTGSWSAALATTDCQEGSEATRSASGNSELSFVPDRTYFVDFSLRASRLGIDPQTWYSVASNSAQDPSRWILTESNGNARLVENDGRAAATFGGWGDNITSLGAACGTGWHVLVTGTGDWTWPDHIQVYQLADRQAIALGQPLEFPGPILALWPSDDGKSVRVVSRNLPTRMYEASIVSVSCGD